MVMPAEAASASTAATEERFEPSRGPRIAAATARIAETIEPNQRNPSASAMPAAVDAPPAPAIAIPLITMKNVFQTTGMLTISGTRASDPGFADRPLRIITRHQIAYPTVKSRARLVDSG